MNNVFLGSSRCGLSLVSGIINCVPDITINNGVENLKANTSLNEFYFISIDLQSYTIHNIRWLDKLNCLRSPEDKYIWVVRNPADSACSLISIFGITEQEALQFWFDVNTVLWYFYTSLPDQKRFMIRYEDILVLNKPTIKLFGFLNLLYNEQYLRYGDFDQPKLDCPTFNRGRIDIEQLSSRQKSAFLTEEECSIYRNKPLLKFLNYDISVSE